jgi:metallo-beta-lactamase class B
MIWNLVLLLVAAIALPSCAAMPSNRLNITEEKTLLEPSLEKIAEGVWIHKSYENFEPWGAILSQGLVLKTDAGVILVDTAWNDEDTERLLKLIELEIGASPSAAVVTHAHQDKMGGMNALHDAGIQTWAYELTNEDAPGRNLTPAQGWFGNTFAGEASDFQFDGVISGARIDSGLMTFIPGPGHTRDNIVVYYAPAKIVFGGCLIRPGKSKNLGNTADADVANWADAVRSVAAEFPDAETIIPSHGPKGGRDLFDHTIALAEAANE